MELRIDQIQLHEDLQLRASTNWEHVEDLVEVIQAGNQFKEAPVVFQQDNVYWLADGYHRVYAFQKAGVESAEFDVRDGSFRDAKLHAIQSNTSHGLKRTNADKRRAVEMLLKDEEWAQRSASWIAETAGVSHPTVLNIKSQLVNFTGSPTNGKATPEFAVGKDGKGRPARKKKPSQPELYFCQICKNSFTEKEGDCPRCFPPEDEPVVDLETQVYSCDDGDDEELLAVSRIAYDSMRQTIFNARLYWPKSKQDWLREQIRSLFECEIPSTFTEEV